RLQVGPGAEADAAGAGHDENACPLVGLEGAKALQQPLGRRSVDRVAPVLAVDRQDGGGPDALVADLVYQPPAQSRAGRCRLRRALRLSSAFCSSESGRIRTGKKMMTMNPALVTTLSSDSP